MRISLKSSALGLAVVGALAIAAPSAWAGCAADAVKSPAMFDAGHRDGAMLIRVANQNGQGNGAPIVGLWSVTLTAGGNTVDFGYSEWHADGTEIMNSGGHAASAGNFCLGVWAQTGANTYHLNHFALAYDPTNWNTGAPFPNPIAPGEAAGGLIAKINLIEDVVLAPGGNSFTGHFTQIGYDPNHPGTVLPQFGAAGTIVGTRITP
jgi:hypothetical protein